MLVFFISLQSQTITNKIMPTIFKLLGLRFFFYSLEHLPIHVHVSNADGEAKFEVESLELISNKGIKPKDLKTAKSLLIKNKELILKSWNEYHGE